MLLGLTAGFDMVDHGILISRLERWVRIRGTALDWFRSYLSDKTFWSLVVLSPLLHPFSWGVPQGFILGPLLFCINMPLCFTGDDCQECIHSEIIFRLSLWHYRIDGTYLLTFFYISIKTKQRETLFHPEGSSSGLHVDLDSLYLQAKNMWSLTPVWV